MSTGLLKSQLDVPDFMGWLQHTDQIQQTFHRCVLVAWEGWGDSHLGCWLLCVALPLSTNWWRGLGGAGGGTKGWQPSFLLPFLTTPPAGIFLSWMGYKAWPQQQWGLLAPTGEPAIYFYKVLYCCWFCGLFQMLWFLRNPQNCDLNWPLVMRDCQVRFW